MKRINCILTLIIFFFISTTGKTLPVNIWEGTSCKKKVLLTPFLASGNNNTAIIVCPGGSYFWHDKSTEGVKVAEWLRSQGISAFVLEYRVGTIPGFITHNRLSVRGNRYPDMLQDIQRSIQYLRIHADEYHINPAAIGVMGFSAGGHLAAMSGIYFDSNVLRELGVPDNINLRPDFIAPIYPVVTMTESYTHKRSRRGALGEGKSITSELKDSLSLERHVRKDMPPTFLMNCVDDPIVDFRNSMLLDSAMTRKNVPHLYIKYLTGGHGFGVSESKTSPEAAQWKYVFLQWLKDNGFINN